MNNLQRFLEGGLMLRTISRRELRELDLVSIINSLPECHPPYSLKIKAHLIEAFSQLLLRVVKLLQSDIGEFEQEHFYAQVKEKRIRTGNPTRKRKRKTERGGAHEEHNLMNAQEEAERQIDEAISSKKNTADKKDINLPPRFPQDKSDDSQTSVNKLQKTDNFRDILNSVSQLPMNNDNFNDMPAMPQSGEKPNTFMDQLRSNNARYSENIEMDVSRLASEYKDLLETTAETTMKPVSTRKTHRKTVVKPLGVTLDERINLATLIEDVTGSRDATETKRKDEPEQTFLSIKPMEFIAEELQSFSLNMRLPLLDETRNKFAELHKSIMLNQSLSNTFLGGFNHSELEYLRTDHSVPEGGDLMEFLTGKKSRSGSKSNDSSSGQRIKQEVEIEAPNLSTILQTNDNFSLSPSKRGDAMNSLQVVIVDMISKNMKDGRTNLNELIAERRPNKMLKAQLFVEVLSLNFKMSQDSPATFGDIYIQAG